MNAATMGFIPFGELSEEDKASLTEVEQARLARMANFLSEGNGYFSIQSTRPQTLSFALTDSPVGQLAWIIEKFKEWTGSDHDLPEEAVGLDAILTNVSLYWFTQTAGSAANMYYESMHGHDWPTPSQVPTGVAVFAEDVAIRRYAEQSNNIVHWSDIDAGGHFAALETPDLLVADVRAFFAGCVGEVADQLEPGATEIRRRSAHRLTSRLRIPPSLRERGPEAPAVVAARAAEMHAAERVGGEHPGCRWGGPQRGEQLRSVPPPGRAARRSRPACAGCGGCPLG